MRKTIEEMEKEKLALERAIAFERDRTRTWSQEMLLAEAIHERCCIYNHCDECGWGYEKDWSGRTHTRYLNVAKTLLKDWDNIRTTDPDFIDKAVTLIRQAVRP